MGSHPWTLGISLNRLKNNLQSKGNVYPCAERIYADSAPWSICKFSTFHWLNAFSVIFLTHGINLNNLWDVLGDFRPPHRGGPFARVLVIPWGPSCRRFNAPGHNLGDKMIRRPLRSSPLWRETLPLSLQYLAIYISPGTSRFVSLQATHSVHTASQSWVSQPHETHSEALYAHW